MIPMCTMKTMADHSSTVVQTGEDGRPHLTGKNLNLRAAEAALVRHVAKHAETLTAAATMLGLSARQLVGRARRLRVRLPFSRQGGRS